MFSILLCISEGDVPSFQLCLHYPSGECGGLSLIFCVVFCRSLFVLFIFGHCVVWYLQILNHRVCNQINTMGATSGAGPVYPFGAHEFTPVFSGVRITRSLVLYVCFVDHCLSFCPFSFGHCVVFLQFTDSDYPLVSSNSSSNYKYI